MLDIWPLALTLALGTSIGRNFGPNQQKFDVIFWWLYLLHKWVCYYIGICSTNIGNDYYRSEMSAMNLLKLWKWERNIDFDVKFYLYRKVKGNLSMIIVIDITCMYISTYVSRKLCVDHLIMRCFWCMMPHTFPLTVQRLICQKFWDFTLQTEIVMCEQS